MTLLLLRMLLFILKAAKQLQPTVQATVSCIYHCLTVLCVKYVRQQKLKAPTTAIHNEQPLYYQGYISLQLMSCHPKHPSTYPTMFANTVYTELRKDNN